MTRIITSIILLLNIMFLNGCSDPYPPKAVFSVSELREDNATLKSAEVLFFGDNFYEILNDEVNVIKGSWDKYVIGKTSKVEEELKDIDGKLKELSNHEAISFVSKEQKELEFFRKEKKIIDDKISKIDEEAVTLVNKLITENEIPVRKIKKGRSVISTQRVKSRSAVNKCKGDNFSSHNRFIIDLVDGEKCTIVKIRISDKIKIKGSFINKEILELASKRIKLTDKRGRRHYSPSLSSSTPNNSTGYIRAINKLERTIVEKNIISKNKYGSDANEVREEIEKLTKNREKLQQYLRESKDFIITNLYREKDFIKNNKSDIDSFVLNVEQKSLKKENIMLDVEFETQPKSSYLLIFGDVEVKYRLGFSTKRKNTQINYMVDLKEEGFTSGNSELLIVDNNSISYGEDVRALNSRAGAYIAMFNVLSRKN